jgi:hypothetical protein
MLQFTPEDFVHMIPNGAKENNEIFYGPTNYAVYIDIQVPDIDAGGGFGVLLNGSAVNKSGTEYRSGGYIFQVNPGNNGFNMRYYCYNGTNGTSAGYGERGSGGVPSGGTFSWGARPMYFYDAAKENNLYAPKEISFFKAATGADMNTINKENFSENAGAKGDNLNYRLPFSANSTSYSGQITGDSFSTEMEGRNNRAYLDRNSSPWNPHIGYGMMYGMDSSYISLYSPKHMQSWHNYSGTTIKDTLTDNEDNRLGFRWDRSWHMFRTGNDDTQQRLLWEQRHILKLTVLEVTKNIMKDDIEPEWQDDIGGIVHKAGDMFVRAELIQLKKGKTDWLDSRNYVYSKPIWFGKFKGDAWRGDDLSPFKKLGNTMQHIVADPEPRGGDDQSNAALRGRGMRVRSWKESFLGWNFDDSENYQHWWDFVNDEDKQSVYNNINPFNVPDTGTKKFPPDFYKTQFDGEGKVSSAFDGTYRISDSIWTPPIAINLNANGTTQSGGNNDNTFGQYSDNQSVGRTKRGSNTAYTGTYDSNIYGRLSILRPSSGNNNPIFGLYAMRGWDFGNSGRDYAVYDTIITSYGYGYSYNTYPNSSKRFLTVVQGLQLPYQPEEETENGLSGAFYREPDASATYQPDRNRILGLRFWRDVDNANNSTISLYDMWIGEGFSPREVRAILGLKTTDQAAIRNTYVGDTEQTTPSPLELQGFYMPESYVPEGNP